MSINDGWNFSAIKLNTERIQSIGLVHLLRMRTTNSHAVFGVVLNNIIHIKRK